MKVRRWLPALILLAASVLCLLAMEFLPLLVTVPADWSPLGFLMRGLDRLVGPTGWETLIRRLHLESFGMEIPYVLGSASALGGVFLVPYIVAGIVARERCWQAILVGSTFACALLTISDTSTWWGLNVLAYLLALPFLLFVFACGKHLARKRAPGKFPSTPLKAS